MPHFQQHPAVSVPAPVIDVEHYLTVPDDDRRLILSGLATMRLVPLEGGRIGTALQRRLIPAGWPRIDLYGGTTRFPIPPELVAAVLNGRPVEVVPLVRATTGPVQLVVRSVP